MKKITQHIVLFFSLILVSCNDANWNENYNEDSKTPFGTYIINNEIENLFPSANVTILDNNIYDKLMYADDDREQLKANYICIKSSAFKINEDGIERLIKFVAEGNDAFISLNDFYGTLENALEIKIQDVDSRTNKEAKGYLYFENKNLMPRSYYYNRNLRQHYFSEFNPENTIILGTHKIDGEEKPNFLKIYYGKGAFYVHCSPITFTNYYMMKKDNAKYVANVFSYMRDNELVFIDPQIEYSKYTDNTKNKEDEDHANSALRFFWQNESLKWSMLIAFFGLLAFMLFNARRKQRPIPEIKKLKNPTVEFTHTIANLYLEENNPKNLVDKKITYFLQHIRTNYILNTSNLDERFVERLASKSGNTVQSTKFLINSIVGLYNRTECTQDELVRLDKSIENFFNPEKKS